MRNGTIKVEEFPTDKIPFKCNFSIESNKVTSFTHGYLKYPCKFIPHIPRWAIKRYATGSDEVILDPFVGSGTTLVEAAIAGKTALGIDFDPLSRLLAKVKSTPLPISKIYKLKIDLSRLLTRTRKLKGDLPVPKIPNIDLWFSKKTIDELSRIKQIIEDYYNENNDKDIRDFLLIAFASIIRKVSFAENQSPKPYVSKKIKKVPKSVFPTFVNTVDNNLEKMIEFTKVAKSEGGIIIGDDAREINKNQIKKFSPEGIDLAITSPPYINAFDYVRSLKLENFWLGFVDNEIIKELKKKQIGTEFISNEKYKCELPETGNIRLDNIIKKIYKVDKKRAYVVLKYFNDMKINIEQVFNNLKDGGFYCIVVGDSKIRGVIVPTHEILIDISREIGFDLDCLFSYTIKNRYLRFPRQGKGGLIEKDWIFALKK